MIAPSLVPYKQVGDAVLHLHLFAPAAAPGERRPAIVFFFGGGWRAGNPAQFYPQCRHLAARGMVAVAAEYRVQSRNGTSPLECVSDGKSAVRFLRAHAGELGIDPRRIATGGGSAGGHVSLCTGTVPGFDEPAEDCAVSSRPDAMVAFNPVADTTNWVERIGDRWREISPLHHVRPGVPPALIFHGRADSTVPIVAVERYRDAMLAAGNRCELVAFDGYPHGFFNYFREDRRPYYATLAAMDCFLASLGFLPV